MSFINGVKEELTLPKSASVQNIILHCATLHFVNDEVAEDSSHLTALSSAS